MERDLLSARRHSFIGSDPLVLRDSRELTEHKKNEDIDSCVGPPSPRTMCVRYTSS